MTQRSLVIQRPYQVEIQEAPAPSPGPQDVLVRTKFSAISAGTEQLVYQGQVPSGLDVDSTIQALPGTFRYPLKYGYTTVGTVIDAGSAVDDDWIGRRVFCFHPHESVFLALPQDLIPLPDDIEWFDALFLPNMETAVNFLMDGRPLLGECVAVLGLGIVGLLTCALASQFPLTVLAGLDPVPMRREMALKMGANAVCDPQQERDMVCLHDCLNVRNPEGKADLLYEVSGSPDALNTAIALAGFASRIVIGSWYGTKQTSLDLGGAFHRNRIRLISSQVSTIAPELTGRWTKHRRFEVVTEMIRTLAPRHLITHTFPLEQAADAFTLLTSCPNEVLQIVLTYSHSI